MAQDPQIVLYQFAFSHYNEKVRWTLDWKGLPSRRESLLPGFHTGATRRAADATQTPVITYDGEGVAGSTDIGRFLDARHPERPLWPADGAEAARVDEWVTWLDDEVGPAVRLALFHELFEDRAYAGEVFTTGRTGWKASAYRRMMPVLTKALRGRMSIDDANAATARETVAKALDRVAEGTAERGYLVGDGFTFADLTAASLLMPLTFPDEVPFEMPTRPSAILDGWLAKWAGHPAVRWTRETWRRHRRP